MGFLHGKRILIVGLINNKSIATSVAQAIHREGGELAFTTAQPINASFRALTHPFDPCVLLPCDIASSSSVLGMIEQLGNIWPHLDAIVHTVPYSPEDELSGHYQDILSKESAAMANDMSDSSFNALTASALPLLRERCGNVLSIYYLGAQYSLLARMKENIRYLATNFGPQGIRVNGVFAGPIKSCSDIRVKKFKKSLDDHKKTAPLRKNIEASDVGNVAAFLCSDLAAGITGEIVHVDAGFHMLAK